MARGCDDGNSSNNSDYEDDADANANADADDDDDGRNRLFLALLQSRRLLTSEADGVTKSRC